MTPDMKNDTRMFVTDDDGNEYEMEILFTFAGEGNGKQYVVYQPTDSSSEEVFASIYDDEGNLFQIEDDEELAMVEEVLGAFLDDEEE